jgi:hypothetical protein
MAQPCRRTPVLLVVAAFSRHAGALDWGRRRLREFFGPLAELALEYAFDHTAYYEPTMGGGLRKQLLVFHDLLAADGLADVKVRTIALEDELARAGTYPEPRPLNLDPGVMTAGKFLLATTKDQQHRIYLRDGIFAEVTLRYTDGSFRPWPWTYADYARPEVCAFLNQARDYYRQRLKQAEAAIQHPPAETL